jgi:uncharacterized protein
MKSRKSGPQHVLVFSQGEEVVQTIIDYCVREKIHAASFTGIGAVKHVQIGFYDASTKEYVFKIEPGPFEVASMNGNLTSVDGNAFIHLHAVLSRMDDTLQCIGAHVKAAVVAVTLEVILTIIDVPISRRYDDQIGLNLLDV